MLFVSRPLTKVNPRSSISIEYDDSITKGPKDQGHTHFGVIMVMSMEAAAIVKPRNSPFTVRQPISNIGMDSAATSNFASLSDVEKQSKFVSLWIYLDPILPYIFQRC